MVVRSHLHFHEGDGELVAFPVVPVNPLAGGRERHRIKKDSNTKLEWEGKEKMLTTIEKPEGRTCYSRSKKLFCFSGLMCFSHCSKASDQILWMYFLNVT